MRIEKVGPVVKFEPLRLAITLETEADMADLYFILNHASVMDSLTGNLDIDGTASAARLLLEEHARHCGVRSPSEGFAERAAQLRHAETGEE